MATKHEAFLSTTLEENGMGEVIVLRKKSPLKVEVGVFLIDAYCLGLRDAFYYEGTEAEIEEKLATNPNPLDARPPAYARKFVEEAIAYAKRLGFAPHKDYKKAARVLGGLKAADTLEDFAFGKDGKPFYIQSRYHSEGDARRIVGKLARACGEDGFDYLLKIGGEDEFDDGFEERILAIEACLGDDHTPHDQAWDGPSEAARRAFRALAARDEFGEDPLFHDPDWIESNGQTVFDALLEVVDVFIQSAPPDFEGDPEHVRQVFISFFMMLMNLHGEDEESADEHFAKLRDNAAFPPELAEQLRAVRQSDEGEAILDQLVHPSPGVTIRPVSLEIIDQTTGHCIFVCHEEYDPDQS